MDEDVAAGDGQEPWEERDTWDGVELARRIVRGELSRRDAIDAATQRAQKVEPDLGAVLEGLVSEDAIEQQLAESLPDTPLAGVPFLIKNIRPTPWARIDSGSKLFARALDRGIAPHAIGSSDFLEAARSAGLVISGVTNSPEFGLLPTTEPALYPPTRNPWNPAHSAGGSSGGAAAAVAAGIVPLAHASDGGGSIRIPASRCGLFGLKSTRQRERGSGQTAARGPLNLTTNLCVSRTVRDTAALLALVENREEEGLRPLGSLEPQPLPPLRIGLLEGGTSGQQPDDQVREAVQRAADLLEQLGHRVERTEWPFDGRRFEKAFFGLWAASVASIPELAREWLGDTVDLEEVLEPFTLGLADWAADHGGPGSLQSDALEVFTEVNTSLHDRFDSYDLLLSPVTRSATCALGTLAPDVPFDDLRERLLEEICFTPVHNAVGTPAMSVPLHWTPEREPVGVQLAAALGEERTLLHLAYQLEEAAPWAEERPPLLALRRRLDVADEEDR